MSTKLTEQKNIIVWEPIENAVVLEPHGEQDWVFGASPMQNKTIFTDGHGWPNYFVHPELQFNRNFDSFSCVTYACLKALTLYIFCVYGIKLDLDEMFTAVMSHTEPGVGNSVRNVLESIRKDGFVEEYIAAQLRYAFDANTTKTMFFAPQPYKLIQEALKSLIKWKINWETLAIENNVPHSTVVASLKYAPAVITGRAWIRSSITGLYVDEGLPANHASVVADYDKTNPDILIDLDTYPANFQYTDNPTAQDLTKLLDPTFRIWSAHKITAEPILAAEPKLLLKLKNMMTNFIRDIHGGLWFVKDGKKQKFNKAALDVLTLLSVNFGVKTVTDLELSKFKETTEFFPVN